MNQRQLENSARTGDLLSAIRCQSDELYAGLRQGGRSGFSEIWTKEILEETLEYLAIWLGNTVDLLEPEVIILGGGAAEMLRPYFSEIQKRMKKWCINSRYLEIPLVSAHYGENAGVAGGAALCLSASLP